MNTRENGSGEEPVIRDNRKIDPETGEARETDKGQQEQAAEAAGSAPAAASAAAGSDLASVELAAQLAERTADLQRLQAEYSNYRKRVERDRVAVKEQAVAGVLAELLPVLDDIGRARDHGELTGGFAKVGESLEAATGKLGLSPFGTKGEPFDPTVHEALMHSYSPDVAEPTCVEILQPGYRIGERVLRPARVAVAEPEDPAPADN
ncbi:nucleotide exchange factor GrpE [Planomonospora sp. ID67723]|uniref:nucleotide exchange factor GrpE n=1 Tax=Planomonospora sp. ID67723 TaxID=2738134 RepID=UPI0018C435A9|nr:nucleotide exchange factor GrpE [Planomonospora sp. ID67723]MBG0827306.1 nucleotide exchange factor GrpE [Planomonospora sp. ID67723]